MITINDFTNMELKIAEIKEVEEHPDADRLYVVKVSLGEEERQLVAGIRKSYTKEELIGKKVVMITNLEPAVIRGQESQGMILAVPSEDGPIVLMPERDVPVGVRIK